GVGLGGPTDAEFEVEDTSARIRAEKLDESLDIITGLWSGEPYSFQGKHYKFDEVTFKPTPIQKPRIPIWCAGSWPLKRPFKRAVKYEGVFPLGTSGDLELSDYEDIGNFVSRHRTSKDPFDIVCMGVSTGDFNLVRRGNLERHNGGCPHCCTKGTSKILKRILFIP
ncbi:MAG: LLM class flavin-dependent oxidoreductase, partial [Candidatus Thorarchaeota archaeon]